MRANLIYSLLLIFTFGCASTEFHERKYVKENSCPLLNHSKRSQILRIANPKNFPKTRYRMGSTHKIEKSTDCSRFVHEIYRRAGLKYNFMTTNQLKSSSQFLRIRESEAKPGDLMLFRGHVGIIASDGKIISATKSKINGSSITKMSKESFRSIRGKRIALRYRCDSTENRLASYEKE
ncbi:MAG: NlpC/P60 family protein [Oligoflexia bacterium]|nr:NlpC/P60 family protein [Oligoflexia bacterium]